MPGGEPGDDEGRVHLDHPGFDRPAQARAEGSAGGQIVAVLPAVDARDIRCADGPADPRVGLLVSQIDQVEQSVGRRMPGTHHQHVPGGELCALRAGDVGQRGGDEPPRDRLGLTGRLHPGPAEGIGLAPGAGGIDHAAGPQFGHLAAGRFDAHEERGALAVGGAGLVDPVPGHRHHPRAGADHRARGIEDDDEGVEVVPDQLVTGGQGVRVGRPPAGGLEQTSSGVVDVVPPRREQPGVPPLPDGGSGCRARLEHDRPQAPLEEVGRGGQADGAGSYHHNGQLVHGQGHRSSSQAVSSASRVATRPAMSSRTRRIRSSPSMPRSEGSSVSHTSGATVLWSSSL